jgi:hypothetical protein
LGHHPDLNHPKSDKIVKEFGDADVGGLPFLVFLNAKGQMMTSLSSAPNPSVEGQAVTFTVTVTSSSSYMPT